MSVQHKPKPKQNGLILAAVLFAAAVAVSIYIQSDRLSVPKENAVEETAKETADGTAEQIPAAVPEEPATEPPAQNETLPFLARMKELREKNTLSLPPPEPVIPEAVIPEPATPELPVPLATPAPEPVQPEPFAVISTEPAQEEFPLELPPLDFTVAAIPPKEPAPAPEKTQDSTDKNKDDYPLSVIRHPLNKPAEYVLFAYYYRPSQTNWDIVLVPVQPQTAVSSK
ncbi:MAG: hypothetical protein LBN39_00795 [Planctomycetaceae bacterium]|jgi:hypothetical protein|nr:hypothetical protein [Planctomycetaceae bacterium]